MEENQNIPTPSPSIPASADQNKLSIPLAIIVAGVIIAGAIYLSSLKPREAVPANPNQQVGVAASLENVRAVSESDHIRGNINASVTVIEYSDTECPFCKIFHGTMIRVMEEYKGQVAWVYRHSPIDGLHPKARREATALECADELGGNDKFWAYTDRLYEITPANNGLDLAELPKIAQYVGLDVAQFNTCLNSNKYDERIEEDVQNARATGGGGTPWSIVITKNGKKYPINGAQPYEKVKQIIDSALEE